MNRTITIIFSVFMLIVFLTIFLACGFVLNSKYQVNKDETRKVLRQLKGRVEYYYNQYRDFTHKGLRQEINDKLRLDQRILVISIFHPKDGMIYAIEKKYHNEASYLLSPVQTNQIYQDLSWQGQPEYREMLLPGTEHMNLKIMNVDNRNFYIEWLYEILTRNEIFDVLKWGFFALVICLFITIIWRLFFINRNMPRKNYDQRSFQGMAPIPPGNHSNQTNQAAQNQTPRQDPPLSPGSQEQMHYRNNNPGPAAHTSSSPTEVNPPLQSPGTSDYSNSQNNQQDNIHKSEPECNLFSPSTGLGWESHLKQRLGLEINRSASFNQDMVFSIILIDRAHSVQNFQTVYSSLAKALIDQFLFQDLAFEYKERGFALIIPDKDLTQGVAALESFQKKIARSTIANQMITVSIGLSSRNGRLVSEDILLKEALRSAEKAQEDGNSQLFAFKVDPDKFRKVVSESL